MMFMPVERSTLNPSTSAGAPGPGGTIEVLAALPASGPISPSTPNSRCQKSDTPPAVGPAGSSMTSGPVSARSMKLRMYGVVALAVISPSRSR